MENIETYEVKAPAFQIGQRLRILSKTAQPFEEEIDDYLSRQELSSCAKHFIENGYVSVMDIISKGDLHDNILEINADQDYIYVCGDVLNEDTGDFFLERDLMDYDEYLEGLK